MSEHTCHFAISPVSPHKEQNETEKRLEENSWKKNTVKSSHEVIAHFTWNNKYNRSKSRVSSHIHQKIWGASPTANHLKTYSLISAIFMPPPRLFPFHSIVTGPALFVWAYVCLWTSTAPFVWNCCNVSSNDQIALQLFLLLDAALAQKNKIWVD